MASAIAEAQIHLLDQAQQAYAAAIGALDAVKGNIEGLDRAHLLIGDDYWEIISALDSITTLLEELRELALGQMQ